MINHRPLGWGYRNDNQMCTVAKDLVRHLIRRTPLSPVHIGSYIRSLYFWREVDKLPVRDFQSVLDAGCGGGHYALEFARRYGHLKVVGYDLKARFTEQRLPQLRLEHRDLLSVHDEESYDFVYCIDVLEHIPDNRRVIANIHRALKPGGYFYLHMPYDHPGKRILPESLFRDFEQWARNEHIGRQYDLEEACHLLVEEGFDVLRSRHTFGFLGELAWELDRLTDGRPYLNTLLAPLKRAMS
ncbi:MAG: class I SAM-dependent methyltransferase, partial [Anaerolineae bacterium]